MSRLAELVAFVQVAECGSITLAAERLEVGKSAVSRRVSDLEERLGSQLLHRTSRAISLTSSGRMFYDKSRAILEDLRAAELSVSKQHSAIEGEIKIVAPQSFGQQLLPSLIEFREQHEGISYELRLVESWADLRVKGYDLAIRIGELQDSSLIARKLTQTDLVLCGSPAYLAQSGVPKSPQELENHACLVYSDGKNSTMWKCRGPNGQPSKVCVTPILKSSNGETLAATAQAGLGLILEPDFIVHAAVERGSLVPVLTEFEWPSYGVYALYPPTRYLPARVRAFLDALCLRFMGQPRWT